MKKLFSSALKIQQRTKVTSLFARNGYKIARTDFDEMVFEKSGTLVNVHFDRASNADSISVKEN
ncbi:hypothetical protein [Vibrio sinaloensis]|uniref:hypothetical protein n=1 Tax=Photobacterium sp. (strain ATCC 43367) TaxID=379097 RepID=UPI00206B204F|nr:hypothetical protein [Vibrio sinaloensis]UPQ90046.1 hypothetical protein MTO69_14890 [Vibrio sinaloensis]